jgi:hypothetical protein
LALQYIIAPFLHYSLIFAITLNIAPVNAPQKNTLLTLLMSADVSGEQSMNLEPCTNESCCKCTYTSCQNCDYESQSESEPQFASKKAQEDSAHDMATSKPSGTAAMQVQFKSPVQRLNVSTTVDLFDQHFDQIATGPLFWLPDLMEDGFMKSGLTYGEIAKKLIRLESASPGTLTAYPHHTDCPSPHKS